MADSENSHLPRWIIRDPPRNSCKAPRICSGVPLYDDKPRRTGSFRARIQKPDDSMRAWRMEQLIIGTEWQSDFP